MSLSELLDRALFSPDQWREIVLGNRAGLDILAYADPKFDAGQMGEIIRGLSKGLDVSIYATPVYTESWRACPTRRLALCWTLEAQAGKMGQLWPTAWLSPNMPRPAAGS